VPALNLTTQILNACSEVFSRHPRYALADQAIRKIVDFIPGNSALPDILAKVSVIKTLYATPFYDIFSFAKHVISVSEFDRFLQNGDFAAVNRIRKGHGIKLKVSTKEIDLYSFSTKYCSFHNPLSYPIYNNLVANLVTKLNSRCRFSPGLQRSDLLDYETYRDAIDAMVESLDLRTYGYKSLDQGLWVLAKYHSVDRLGVKTKDDQWLMDQVSRIVN